MPLIRNRKAPGNITDLFHHIPSLRKPFKTEFRDLIISFILRYYLKKFLFLSHNTFKILLFKYFAF